MWTNQAPAQLQRRLYLPLILLRWPRRRLPPLPQLRHMLSLESFVCRFQAVISQRSAHSHWPADARERRQPECNAIIEELLSWGVTPEYLVGYGISKDLLVACLLLHGHPLPPHLAHLAPQGAHYTVQSSPPRKSALLTRPLDQSQVGFDPLQHTNTPLEEAANSTAPDEALADLEAKRRAMLIARKQATVKRNTERARTLHSEIDNLFALSQAEIVSDHDSGSSSSFAEEVDMAIDTPIEQPTIEESMLPLFTPAAMPTYPITARRPKASDLEAEPTHSLPQHPKRNGVFVPPRVRHSSLVIEVSDGEDEEIDGSDTSERRSAIENPPPPAKPKLERMSSISGARSVEPDRRVDALSTKEQEIKKMMEMIKRMEEKKKLLTKNSDGQKSRGSTPISGSALSPQLPPVALAPASFTSTHTPSPKEESPVPESSTVLSKAASEEAQKEQALSTAKIDEEMKDVAPAGQPPSPTPTLNFSLSADSPTDSTPAIAVVPATSPPPASEQSQLKPITPEPNDIEMDVDMEATQLPSSTACNPPILTQIQSTASTLPGKRNPRSDIQSV